ncbi:lysosome-associated membrane glycoprotein 2 isoform X2 [Gouania willdenowi]|uniref:lysosome-associated membrane glycoprotein 2 isoform X2 n=1 Tax=Gouania willdenowi TaxID=441366 RepID=UPI001056A3AF|nr:lysosome-associated membrane glycoprotein 2 isoform X2 [Gouania willdenowi]
MSPYTALLLFAFMIQMSCGTEVTITTGDQLCLYANLRVNFSVLYEVADQKTQVAVFELPEKVTSDESMCAKVVSVLKLNFGDGHSLSIIFSVKDNHYEANLIKFTYNLRDKTVFKDSVSDELQKVKVRPHIPDVELGTCYTCKSKDTIHISPTVNMTLWNVVIQAFISDGAKSQKTTPCPADGPPYPSPTSITTTASTTTTTAASTTTTTAASTTTASTTTASTTAASTTTASTTAASTTTASTTAASTTTASTTAASTTTASTTAASTTTASTTATSNTTTPNATTPTTTPTTPSTPTPTLPTPTTGNFSVTPVNSTDACLLFNVGLRIGYKQENKYVEKNFDSNKAEFSGSCGVNSSDIVLVSDPITFRFTFTNDTKKFRLHALNVTVTTSSGVSFSVANSSLSLWEASLGSSYMCNKEQNFTIDTLSLFTYNLRVQPFGVKKGTFSMAEECFLDSDLSFLVPIAVGVALSFLIILVLISYLIGRRKSRTGYQSV